MRKEEIIRTLQGSDSTILSFPDRGPWGDRNYRGNCSGWIQAFLVWKYHIQKFAELFSGSGTGYDVCKDLGISYVGADLNPSSVRPGIINLNAITDDVPESFWDADMLFMHPPYGAEIRIPYAGSMYPDPTGTLSKEDLGQMPWDKFISVLNRIVMKFYAALKNGAYMSILMGDVRRNGLHSMFTDIVKPGQLEQVLIKAQHNTMSAGRVYSSRNFVPIEHEYLLVLKKLMPLIISYQNPEKHEADIRDSKNATWADIVRAVMQSEHRELSLDEIYKKIEGHKRTETNPHWKDKVRQVLNSFNCFRSSARGVWSMAA